MPTTGEIGLYFHIPFCRRKCPYCHFYVIPHQKNFQETLLEALKLEWNLYAPLIRGRKIVSVYFGGGTPALLGPEPIGEILSWIGPPADAEITLEANPEDVSSFAEVGINRVSFGVQSFDNDLLKLLGRDHTADQANKGIIRTAKAIPNLTIDLMYEIPGQTLSSWEQTLDEVPSLPITHLSLYNLTFEPQTVFFKKKSQLTPLLPNPEESLKMLDLAVTRLEKAGLQRYEISAFAKPGFESRHNTGYWLGREFFGFGPSAFSYREGKRYRNFADLRKYALALQEGKSPVDFEETLSPLASLHERLAIQLRMLEGVDMREYPVENYQLLEDKGWIVREGNRARLTHQGLLFYDSVAEEIILAPQ